MRVSKWIIPFMGFLLAIPSIAKSLPPIMAQGTPDYTWPVTDGTDIIWWNNATGTSWFEKSHVIEVNQTDEIGTPLDIMWEKTYKWNGTTSNWDALYNGETGASASANHSWQDLSTIMPLLPAGQMGYIAAWLSCVFLIYPGTEAHPNVMPWMTGAVNMTWVNHSYYILYELIQGVPVPSNYNSTIQDLTWVLTNDSTTDIIVYNMTWTSRGILEFYEERNNETGELIEKEILVTPPTISLISPDQYSIVVAGDQINCAVDASALTTLQTVKYFWSSVETSPDWNTMGTVISNPTQIPVPTGFETIAYLHVQVIDELGQETQDVFQFRIGSGISSAPLFLVGLAVLAGVFFLTRRHSRRVQIS